MKQLMSIIVFLAVLVLQGQNLLKNPSFEIQSEQDSAMPENWTVIKRGSFETTHSLNGKQAFSGKRSVQIDNSLPATEKATLIWTQGNFGDALKKIPAGTDLEFSVRAAAVEKPCKVRIYFESLQAKKTYLKAAGLQPGKWTEIAVKFKKLDVNYGAPYVCLQLVGNGRAVFDCAYLGPAGKSPWKTVRSKELIVNGNAEDLDGKNGPAGWTPIKKGKGTAETTTADASAGKRAFRLSCEEKPGGMLAWRHHLREECFKGLKPGTEMELSLKANTGGNPATVFRFYIEFRQKNGKFIGTYIAQNQTIYVGWKEKRLWFKLPKGLPASANVYVQLMTAGVLTFDEVSLKPAVAAPKKALQLVSGNYCRISSKMPMSNTFYSPAVPGDIELECYLPEKQLKVELFEIDGPKIREWNFTGLVPNKKSTVKMTLPDQLKKSAYELRFSSGNLTDHEWFRLMDKPAAGSYFDESGYLVLDGSRFFPVGIVTPSSEQDSLRVYSESGINVISANVLTSPQMADYLFSILGKYNIACFAWNNWGIQANIKTEALRKKNLRIAETLARHKGFIGFLADEALWLGWELSAIRRDYAFNYKYLPNYISWLNNAPRLTGDPDEPKQSFQAARAYSRASDVTGVDIYPVPEGRGHNNLDNTTIACVGEYADLSRELTWGRKPVWMILQAMGWSEENRQKLNAARPRPTEKQLRFMVWNAITHGATGIFWYGAGARDVYSEWWRGFAKVNLELSAVSRLMLEAPVEKITGLPAGLSGIRGKGFEVIVNEHPKKPAEYNGKTIEPQGVLILTEKPLNIQKPPRFTRQKITVDNNYGIHKKNVLLNAEWTAHPEYLRGASATVYAKQTFSLKNLPGKAHLLVSVDDSAEIFLNNKKLGKITGFGIVNQFDITRLLQSGENELKFTVENFTGPTGLVFELTGPGLNIASGKQTLFSLNGRDNWKTAHCLGRPPVAPWGKPFTLQEHQ
ncbi:MAG: hypothetical protein IKO93_12820 [Lentisphaeria bacterium]|nr:hypothetical protein [Lentisphaeria bacterium]